MANRRARRRRRRRHRDVIRRPLVDRGNPLEGQSNASIFSRFRFRPDTVMFLVGLVANSLMRPTRRSSPLTPLIQVLITLRFVATGGFYSLIGDAFDHTLSPSTVYRSIVAVTNCLCSMSDRFVTFPVAAADDTKRAFFNVAGFPSVLGCVDGTFIRILAPKTNEMDYLNRKGFHSLNVQMICDAKYKITNCVAKWPGSVHDSRVFRDSGICASFQNGTHQGYLLGDSGYPCKPFLMTPFLTPNTPGEEKYNKSLCRTRVMIEQTFGILKRRFACLHSGLRTTPGRACKITVACAVLHNIGIDRQDIVDIEVDMHNDHNNVDIDRGADLSGRAIRNLLVQNYFT